MSTLTIRLPATKHQRLKDFARARGVSLNKLVEEWATVALAQLDAENHYRLRATRGRPEVGLALLDKLDRTLGRRSARKKATGWSGGQGTAKLGMPIDAAVASHAACRALQRRLGCRGASALACAASCWGLSVARLRKIVVSFTLWRSSRPNLSLHRQQSRIEGVSVGTRHNPFQ